MFTVLIFINHTYWLLTFKNNRNLHIFQTFYHGFIILRTHSEITLKTILKCWFLFIEIIRKNTHLLIYSTYKIRVIIWKTEGHNFLSSTNDHVFYIHRYKYLAQILWIIQLPNKQTSKDLFCIHIHLYIYIEMKYLNFKNTKMHCRTISIYLYCSRTLIDPFQDD